MPTSDLHSIYDGTVLCSTNEETIESIDYLHIPKSSNYISDDSRFIVINDESTSITTKNIDVNFDHAPISFCTKALTEMFRQGLSESFVFVNKKRTNSSTSTSRSNKKNRVRTKVYSNFELCSQRETVLDTLSLPMCTTGWSTIDCNEYSQNMSTIAGTIKPFLKDGNIPSSASRILVSIVEFLLRGLPTNHLFDNESCGDDLYVKERQMFQKRFKSLLMSGNQDYDCGDATHFRVEGVTILIPSSIGIHTDDLNCEKVGMTSVLSVNCRIPMNVATITAGRTSKLWKWLDLNGYTDYFNCSIICYSRKCVGNYVDKVTSSIKLSHLDDLRRCIHWALTERVGTVVDYRSTIWNSSIFQTTFRRTKKRRTSSVFLGEYMVVPASYDKMVRLILISYILFDCIFRNVTHICCFSLISRDTIPS